jgi:hypothetical protein
MNCIVLAQILENQHYAVSFDPDSPASPDCYAFGEDRKAMVPHEAVENPVNPTCAGCPNKEFGTAEKGKGKACNDVIRLALISAEDEIETAEIAYLKLPYFSTLDWAGYVRQLTEVHNKPPLAFVTEISVQPDPKSQFRVKFSMVEEIDMTQNVWTALKARYDEAIKVIGFPYPKFEQPQAPAARQPRVAARKATGLPATPAVTAAMPAKRRFGAQLPPSMQGKRAAKF